MQRARSIIRLCAGDDLLACTPSRARFRRPPSELPFGRAPSRFIIIIICSARRSLRRGNSVGPAGESEEKERASERESERATSARFHCLSLDRKSVV